MPDETPRWQTHSRLPLIVDALALAESDPRVQQLIAEFGGDPTIHDSDLGVPVVRVRKLRFPTGAEIVLHDDTVVGVIVHLTPRRPGEGAVDLSQWIDGVTNAATLDELRTALEAKFGFSSFASPHLEIGPAFVRLQFVQPEGTAGGWKEPGNLRALIVTTDQPGLAVSPDSDECPVCSDLLVRSEHAVDVSATIARLEAAVTAKDLTEDPHWVQLADLEPLHASGLMKHVESQLTCRTCHRIICFTLHRDALPTFGWYVLNDAMRHPMEPVPPIDQWAGPERLETAAQAMQYVDHEPGIWFLAQQGDTFYFDARYSAGMIDGSVLIELSDAEAEAYRTGGHAHLTEFAHAIERTSPWEKDSPYYVRDLSRHGGGDPGRDYSREFSAAISNHTWLAEQRSRT